MGLTMQNTFTFDFTKCATRKQMFSTLIAAITDEVDRAMVGRVVGDPSIPSLRRLKNLAEVKSAINMTVAAPEVKEMAKRVYEILAEAEAEVHGCTVEETHFHEVGLGRTVREILGICTAFQYVPAEVYVASAVQVGSGQVECEHGTLDIPAPATAAILRKFNIPVCEERLEGELCTPTSAALIAYFIDEFE